MVLHAVARKLIVFDAGEVKVFEGPIRLSGQGRMEKRRRRFSFTGVTATPAPSLNKKNVRKSRRRS